MQQAGLYLDPLEESLTDSLRLEKPYYFHARNHIGRIVNSILAKKHLVLMKVGKLDEDGILNGLTQSRYPETLIGMKRLNNIQFCVENVIRNNVEGDLIETGVWRGGGIIMMRGVLKAHDVSDRNVWVADSFEGCPPATIDADVDDRYSVFDFLAVGLEEVKKNFDRYNLLDDHVKFLQGWFKDTLPNAPIEKLAVARLDGHMYESTNDALLALYHKISIGGYIIIDDYGSVEACRKAVIDFRAERGIEDEIRTVDWTGVYWQKTK